MSEKRVRREGSSRALELVGGRESPSGQARGQAAGGDAPLEEKPRLRSTDPEEVATLVCSSGAPPAGNPAFACAVASDGLGRKTDRSLRQHAAPPGERFLSHTTTPHRTKHVFSLSLSLSLVRRPQAGLFGLHSPLVLRTRRRCASPASRCGSARTSSSPRTRPSSRPRSRSPSPDFSRSHCLPLQYHPWPPWSLRGKLSIFQIAKTLKYESGYLLRARSTGGCRGRGGRGTSLGANKTESFARPDPLRSFL